MHILEEYTSNSNVDPEQSNPLIQNKFKEHNT